jgi:membrane protease YdiL (CAAX protease family)
MERVAVAVAVVAGAGAALIAWGRVTVRAATGPDGRVDRRRQQVWYQATTFVAALALAVGTTAAAEWPSVLRVGAMDAPATHVSWMGFGPADGWREVGPPMVGWPLLVTTGVVWAQVIRALPVPAGDMPRLVAAAVVWAVPLSMANALSEELIFRAVPVHLMGGAVDPVVIAAACGVLFGVPHWFGSPGKVPGVLMAGFLGWVMAQSVLDTGGLGWAWVIHVAQDVPILTMILVASDVTSSR